MHFGADLPKIMNGEIHNKEKKNKHERKGKNVIKNLDC
jgi:hypothetical protein